MIRALQNTVAVTVLVTLVATHAAAQTLPIPPAPPARPMPGQAWEKTFQSPALEYELRDVAASGDALWMAVGTRPKGSLGGTQKVELWRIDSRGERTGTLDLSSLGSPDRPDERYQAFYALTALPTGQAVLMFQGVQGLGFVVVDGTAKVATNVVIRPAAVSPFVARMKVIDGHVVALGRHGSDGWLLKIRPDGQVVSDIKVAGVSVLQDAFAAATNWVVLGANVKGVVGQVWFGQVSANGNPGTVLTFAGVNPSVVVNPKGGWTVVYAANATRARQVVLQPVTASLTAGTPTTLPELIRGMRAYAADGTSGGDLILSGEGEAGVPLTRRVKADGAVAWRHEQRGGVPSALQLGNSRVVAWNDDRIVAQTQLVLDTTGPSIEQRQIMKVFRVNGR